MSSKTNTRPTPEAGKKSKRKSGAKTKGRKASKKEKKTRIKLVDSAANLVVKTPDAPAEGVKSGAYIRELLKTEEYTAAEILAGVHANYEDSKAKRSDISFQMNKLRKDGKKVRTLRQLKDGTRKLLDF